MRILTVDDDKNQLKTLSLSLRSSGFDVRTAQSADGALSCLETEHREIDLVITDFAMPGMNGIELLKSIKKKYPAIPVIMISGTEEQTLAENVYENGCSGFIAKPCTIGELDQTINRIFPYPKNYLKEGGQKMATGKGMGPPIEAVTIKTGKYLTFTLKDEEYGIGILRVKEIIGMMQVTSIPRSPDFVKGVINLRGKVIPVIDFRIKFSMDSVPYTERTCIIVVEIDSDDTTVLIGIVVDSVSEVLNIGEEDIAPPPQFGTSLNTSYILGMAKIEGSVKILLDIDKILNQEEVTQLDNVS